MIRDDVARAIVQAHHGEDDMFPTDWTPEADAACAVFAARVRPIADESAADDDYCRICTYDVRACDRGEQGACVGAMVRNLLRDLESGRGA